MVRGRLRVHHRITVEVANRLPADAPVEVRERVPVPRPGDDDLRILPGEVAPPWEPWTGEHGELEGGQRWRVVVPAGATVTLRAAYAIELPAGMELEGGNRREGA